MTPVDSLLVRLRHRNAAVRAAARKELAATLARHGGDEHAAAKELTLSVRTLRKELSKREQPGATAEAAAPVAEAAAATVGATAVASARRPAERRPAAVERPDDGVARRIAPGLSPNLSALPAPRPADLLPFPAAPRSPFSDFEPRHRSPLGDQLSGATTTPSGTSESGETWPRSATRHHTSPQPVDGTSTAPAPTALAMPPSLPATATGEWPHHQPDAPLEGAGPVRAVAAPRRLAFVLHAHLPWVLGHGRWPHGEDWLAEAIVHCYVPLVGALRRLAARGGRHLLTVSVSPVLAAQLADPRTRSLVEDYLAHRRTAARELVVRHPLAAWWDSTYEALTVQWQELEGDLLGSLATLAKTEVIELSTCAVTHGYLPLLHRPEHVALQIAAACHNHERWFGRRPLGLWMPECAYRPAGPWRHAATAAEEAWRPGNEEFLAAAGVRWTVVDAHLLLGGEPLAPYSELWGAIGEEEQGERRGGPLLRRLQPKRIAGSEVTALPREPHTAHQVWSRHGGYPGDPRYLDFHKREATTGLRLWRVTDAASDLGEKLPYHPAEAREAVADQARHFHELVAGVGGLAGGIAVCPYDAELFGHWWFEGVAWLEEVLGRCLEGTPVTPGASITTTTPGRELAAHPPTAQVALHEGSWGEAGDHSVWASEATAWMWEELRQAEDSVHSALPSLPPARARAALKQLLLLAASDWPFLVTTGTAADYATERFRGHRDRLRELLAGPTGDVLPSWATEDLAGVEIEPAWWSESTREP